MATNSVMGLFRNYSLLLTNLIAAVCFLFPIVPAAENQPRMVPGQIEPAQFGQLPTRPSIIKFDPVPKTPAHEFKITFELNLPQGYHLNPKAPSRLRYYIEELGLNTSSVALTEAHQSFKLDSPNNLMNFTVRIDANIFYCRTDGTGSCLIKALQIYQPVILGEAQNPDNSLTIRVSVT